jgi:tripartite-type tricarboxylate transporter receptor subunit TctC
MIFCSALIVLALVVAAPAWAGLFTPRGVPPAVVKTLREATRVAVGDGEFKAAMDKAQTPIAYQDADEFKAWWDRDAAMLADVIKKIGRVETK